MTQHIKYPEEVRMEAIERMWRGDIVSAKPLTLAKFKETLKSSLEKERSKAFRPQLIIVSEKEYEDLINAT